MNRSKPLTRKAPLKTARKPMARGNGATLRKDETRCRNCGDTNNLHVHHVIPRSMCRAGRHDDRNGVTLCARCHHGWHHRTVTIHRDILTAEEWAFVSSLELVGQNLAAWLDDRYPERPAGELAA